MKIKLSCSFMSKTNFLIGKSRVHKITILAWGLGTNFAHLWPLNLCAWHLAFVGIFGFANIIFCHFDELLGDNCDACYYSSSFFPSNFSKWQNTILFKIQYIQKLWMQPSFADNFTFYKKFSLKCSFLNLLKIELKSSSMHKI